MTAASILAVKFESVTSAAGDGLDPAKNDGGAKDSNPCDLPFESFGVSYESSSLLRTVGRFLRLARPFVVKLSKTVTESVLVSMVCLPICAFYFCYILLARVMQVKFQFQYWQHASNLIEVIPSVADASSFVFADVAVFLHQLLDARWLDGRCAFILSPGEGVEADGCFTDTEADLRPTPSVPGDPHGSATVTCALPHARGQEARD